MRKTVHLTTAFVAVVCLLGLSLPAAAQTASSNSGNQNVQVSHYQDWEVRCHQVAGTKKCEMAQLVNNPNTGKPLMQVIMAYPAANKAPAMAFILPLGIRLLPGVQIHVGSGKPLRIPFRVCLKRGCRAVLPVKSSLLATFRNGLSSKITVIGPRGNKINLKLSLMGFTAASKAIAP